MCKGLAEPQARVLGSQDSAGVGDQAGDEARLVPRPSAPCPGVWTWSGGSDERVGAGGLGSHVCISEGLPPCGAECEGRVEAGSAGRVPAQK